MSVRRSFGVLEHLMQPAELLQVEASLTSVGNNFSVLMEKPVDRTVYRTRTL